LQVGYTDLFSKLRDHRNQVHRGPRCAFRVVLVCCDCAPHTHHSVPDELVDLSAVSLDDLAAPVEVDGEHGTNILWVSVL